MVKFLFLKKKIVDLNLIIIIYKNLIINFFKCRGLLQEKT